MDKNEHLEQAKAYTQQLFVERHAASGTADQALAANQGEVMRDLIYHCTAAIVGAIDDLRESVDSHGGA